MRKVISLFMVYGLWCMVCGVCYAGEDEVGVAGMGFLKVRFAARTLGMGNAFVAVADDIGTLACNVGGLANSSGQQFLFTHLSYLDGVGCNNIGYAIGGKQGTLGLGFTMRLLTIDETGVQYEDRGQISIRDQVFSFAYSRKFREVLTYGAGADLFTSVMGDYSVITYGLNFGGLYFAPWGVVIGFAARNLGPEYQYKSETFTGAKQPLPATFVVGITKRLKIPGGNFLTTFDVVKDYTFRGNIGVEYVLGKMLVFRTGYKLGYDSGGFTLGMGVNYKPKGLDRFQFDYAFSPLGDLGDIHCVSVITKF